MRFWQALITAEMAAGAVYADTFRPDFWAPIAIDAGNVFIGWIMWCAFEALFPTTPPQTETQKRN